MSKRHSTQRKIVHRKLKDDESFRIRKAKYHGIVSLLQDGNYPWIRGQFSSQTIVNLCVDFMSMNRMWNKILQEEPELRGYDYDDKTTLKQEAQLDMGYEVSYHENVKKLRIL